MENKELRPCAICGKGIANNGQAASGPLVGARVTVQRLVINPQALHTHVGLETHFALGGPAGARALADLMGPGSVIDEPAEFRSEFLVCEWCLMAATDMPPLLVVLENEAERRGKASEELEATPAADA